MSVTEAWTLQFGGSEPAREGLREALCTLGNGYLATRGALPERDAGGPYYPGTYAAGCYNRMRDSTAGGTVENESLVNLPNWLPLTFRADHGPWLGQAGVELLDQRHELDLLRGVLTRRLRVRDGDGRVTAVTQWRFVHQRHEHVCGLQVAFTPESWSGTLTVRSEVDATTSNRGVARYQGLAGQHLELLDAGPAGTDTVLCVVQTNQSHIRVAEAARTRVLRRGRAVDAGRRVYREPGRIGHELEIDVSAGEQVTVEKLVTVHTSRDNAISDPADEAVQRSRWLAGFDELLDEHVLAWRHLWRRFRISMQGEESRVLPTVRLHLFHLLQTVSENSVDADVGIPARGLHGEAYRGHVLWDELFVFPILNLRMPLLSRALLRYRYRRLPWARAAARAAGHSGAMYPWQSGSDGREESQRLHLNPLSGRWVKDSTRLQRHVGLAVAYNVWQYYQVAGDLEFLNHYGAEMILEIARFFAGLADYDDDRDRYVIRGVMGPDEFHTGYPHSDEEGIDNNAYTNVLTAWVMLRALDVLDLLSADRRAALVETLGITPGEPQRWADISRRMYVPIRPDGIIDQFDGYADLAELDWNAYRDRFGDIRRLDRILESQGDSPNRYKASKQADVLMLFYLLSADELRMLIDRLGYSLPRDAISKNIEYYLSRTAHGSTLSAVVHAWVLARNHRAQALRYFVEALDTDVADIQGGTTAEGIHLAAMAGSVDILQRCFAGVETRDDTLVLNPYWPPHLGALELDIRYRAHPLTLRITGDAVQVEAGPSRQPPIQLSCRGETVLLAPGEVVEFPVPQRGRAADGE
ncbi:glycoside hydrolase family 65 protein [Dactylosporangium aurantiacum]|uniref:Glycoside hydrolase family 65 protein n=1 Tax=Dactylosporangium aurantiacum TaxID=35754 RepID=A0A9Q9ISD6_9ACTN|nr:glycoside hydrolase family 65 protein [Dactylosporangium aurantiacum]MDG6108296.1 glycoside hydrolase family 65 protein [Dactylosporangium aurantiacum]UWZ58515.1 glycoside hydrolase family 65 protein [Dactylosporangium aurantiacum]